MPKKIALKKPAQATLLPSAGMRLIGARQLVSSQVPARKLHWGERIQQRQIGMVAGPRGKGKTWFTLTLAVAISAGGEYLGMSPKKARRVIYLDGEMDLKTIQDRLSLIAAGLGVKLNDELKIFTPESFAGLLPMINSPEGQRDVEKLIGTEWDILIVDNYSAWANDGRETAEAWAPFMKWMLQHKHAGRTIVVVHHTGKNGAQRGSSRHEDALDWSILLEAEPSLQAEDATLRFVLRWTKTRHLPLNKCGPLTVEMKSDLTTASWKFSAGERVDPQRASAYEMFDAGQSDAVIARQLGVDRSTIGRWRKQRQ